MGDGIDITDMIDEQVDLDRPQKCQIFVDGVLVYESKEEMKEVQQIKIKCKSSTGVKTIVSSVEITESVHGPVSSTSGDIRVGTFVQGNVQATSGNVTAQQIHKDASSVSGNIHCAEIRGNASTLSGDIKKRRM